jgi:hypothetical protein
LQKNFTILSFQNAAVFYRKCQAEHLEFGGTYGTGSRLKVKTGR